MTGPIDDQGGVHLTLDVTRGPGPITGAVTGPDGSHWDFCGWTSLTSVIDLALARSAASDPPTVVADGGFS